MELENKLLINEKAKRLHDGIEKKDDSWIQDAKMLHEMVNDLKGLVLLPDLTDDSRNWADASQSLDA